MGKWSELEDENGSCRRAVIDFGAMQRGRLGPTTAEADGRASLPGAFSVSSSAFFSLMLCTPR